MVKLFPEVIPPSCLGALDISFIHQPHPLMEEPVEADGIQIASPTDIGLMKLATINSRGSRRDFVDIYRHRDIISLDRLLELAKLKYVDRPGF